jgi:hypothetical protein
MWSAVLLLKKATSVGIPRARGGGNVRGGFDPHHRNAGVPEVLQQITVVGGHLHHQGVRAQPEATDHGGGITACMLDPACGIGGKIRVIAEDFVRRNNLLHLHQKARVTDTGMKRIGALLTPLDLLQRQVGVGQRHHAEIHQAAMEVCATEPATRMVHGSAS